MIHVHGKHTRISKNIKEKQISSFLPNVIFEITNAILDISNLDDIMRRLEKFEN